MERRRARLPTPPARRRLPHGLRAALRPGTTAPPPGALGDPRRRRPARSAARRLPRTCEIVGARGGLGDRDLGPAVLARPTPVPRTFDGRQLHTVGYRTPQEFAGQRVAIVGGGNSAAQILAEVSDGRPTPSGSRRASPGCCRTTWMAAPCSRLRPSASARSSEGREHAGVGGLGDIVVVASVRDARDRGVLNARAHVRSADPDRTGVGRRRRGAGGRRSSGAPASAPPCVTSPDSGCATIAAASRPAARAAPRQWQSRGCSSSGTATGPDRHQPP